MAQNWPNPEILEASISPAVGRTWINSVDGPFLQPTCSIILTDAVWTFLLGIKII